MEDMQLKHMSEINSINARTRKKVNSMRRSSEEKGKRMTNDEWILYKLYQNDWYWDVLYFIKNIKNTYRLVIGVFLPWVRRDIC